MKFICFLLGHEFYVIRELTQWSRKVGCRRCSKQWGMNDDCHSLVPWCSAFDDFHKKHIGKLEA